MEGTPQATTPRSPSLPPCESPSTEPADNAVENPSPGAAAGTTDHADTATPVDATSRPSERDMTAQGFRNADVEEPRAETVKRTAKTKVERDARKGCKPGNRGRFHGEELAYLESLESIYEAIPKGKSGRNDGLEEFWDAVGAEFWQKFDWEKVRRGMGADAQHLGHGEVVARTNKSIKGWFRRKHSANEGKSNPWTAVIQSLRTSSVRAPKKTPAAMIYLSRYPDRINEVFHVERETSQSQDIALRNEIARRLYQSETDEVKAECEGEATRQLEEKKARYEDGLAGIISTDPEDQEQARENMCAAVTPLLEIISQCTGFKCVSLIAGSPPTAPTEPYVVGTVHYGKSNETLARDFGSFNREGFRSNVIGEFQRFLRASKTYTGDDATDNIEIIDTGKSAGEEDVLEPDQANRARGQTRGGNGKDSSSTSRAQGKSSKGQQVSAVPKPLGPSPAAKDVPPTRTHTAAKDGPPTRTHTAEAHQALTLTKDANKALAQQVDALGPQARIKEIRRINALDDFELDRENNIAKRRALERELLTDLPRELCKQPGSEHQPAQPRPRPRPRPKPTAGLSTEATRRSSRLRPTGPNTSTLSSANSPPDDQPESVNGDHQSPTPAPPECELATPPGVLATDQDASTPDRPTAFSSDAEMDRPHSPSSPSSPTCVQDQLDEIACNGDAPKVDSTDWPEWMDDHYGRFLAEIDQPVWRELLAEWVAFERVLEFQNTRIGFSAKGRPDEVHQWIKTARANRVIHKGRAKYADDWQTWWNNINPEWRERRAGRLVRGGTGDWSSMWVPGKNGFLNILGALSALYELAPNDDWIEAVADVKWVIREARKQKGQRRVKRGPNENNGETGSHDEEQPPAKRLRP
ncbi:hypothetical protein EIP86_008839 [Pleurotus ostreatoroseus]|nr:hypothetical protein EIP86_008839 [Pleurotus ostreatoroseus]